MDAEWLPVTGCVATARRYATGDPLAMSHHPYLWIPYQSTAIGTFVGLSIYLQQLI